MANTPYPQSYYAASANAVPPRPMLQGDVETDVCVIGAGYTGLSSALFLLENGFRVTVLEAAKVGFGASGRNGGQFIVGLASGQGVVVTFLAVLELVKEKLITLTQVESYGQIHLKLA